MFGAGEGGGVFICLPVTETSRVYSVRAGPARVCHDFHASDFQPIRAQNMQLAPYRKIIK